MLLALDTSTSYASVALVDKGRLLGEITWDVGQRHSADLFGRVEWLLQTAKVAPSTLDGVAVATGPGSFNGVRVALTAAKSLAFSLGVPLYGHPTLDVIAWGHAWAGLPVWAVLEAGRGQVYAARYAPASTPAGWRPDAGYMVVTPAELVSHVDGEVVVAGELRAETRAALEAALGERARFAPAPEVRRAIWLAELAMARTSADDPLALEPLYLRKPNITTSAKVGPAAAAQPRQQGDDAHGAPGGEGVTHAIRR
jgi:tRNA threonylcarbamoyladenosine biosynthesis protein TsaB